MDKRYIYIDLSRLKLVLEERGYEVYLQPNMQNPDKLTARKFPYHFIFKLGKDFTSIHGHLDRKTLWRGHAVSHARSSRRKIQQEYEHILNDYKQKSI